MSSGGRPRPARTTAEWAVFAVAALVVAGAVAVIAVDWLAGPSTSPRFLVRQQDVQRVEAGYQVRVEVENQGTEAAADVTVAAELRLEGREARRAEQRVPFMAPGERATTTFVFADDPGRGELTVAVSGFQTP